MIRYLRLAWIQLRASMLLALQYRWDFLIDGAISLFWMVTAVVPLFVAYGDRPSIAGWSFHESLIVVGWFILLQGVLEGAINPSLVAVVDHVRKGTLDFVLMKPADAQFLVSTAKFLPWRSINVFAGGGLITWALAKLGHVPDAGSILSALVLLVVASVLLYSLWIMTVSAAFYVVKMDNLTYFFSSVFDAARWPRTVFRGVLAFVFTFVIPLAVMTSFPAEALLGRLPLMTLVASVVGAGVFSLFARLVWLRSIGHYTSASS